MVTKVRQASRFGTCDVLGEVINETLHAYIFRRPDGETAFISKRAPTLHARTVPYVCGLSSPSGTARGGLERSAAPLRAALRGSPARLTRCTPPRGAAVSSCPPDLSNQTTSVGLSIFPRPDRANRSSLC
jgi:hypothetical protein